MAFTTSSGHYEYLMIPFGLINCIPYVGTIPGGLRPGMALSFSFIPYRFFINHKLGTKDGDDVAFHFNPRVNKSMVRDSFRNGKWEGPEETQWCPFVRGSAFDIFIVTILFSFQAYVNGQRNCFFKHRMPVEKVTTLHIKGDVFMNTIGYVAVSHLLHDKWIKSDWLCNHPPQPRRRSSLEVVWVCTGCYWNPLPLLHDDITDLVDVRHLALLLLPLEDAPQILIINLICFICKCLLFFACSFTINLKTGQRSVDDIAFHFNPRVGTPSVVRNTFRNGQWQNAEETSGGPFVRGGAFDLKINLESVSAVNIHGDIFMTNFGLIEVSSFCSCAFWQQLWMEAHSLHHPLKIMYMYQF
uniref:Galectin n=1 Tax=Pygocentrus nattereri TaxID=42514 RepID=A0AAR2LKT2_PYGNA